VPLVCEPNENIFRTFSKYGEWKPNIAIHKINRVLRPGELCIASHQAGLSESDKGCQMKSVPVFCFIYFEFADAGFREVCQRTCDIVPGGRSPSPICTVVPNPNIEKGNICQRNDTQSPEDGINEVLCTVSTVSVRCSE
jgi:hypothetical protein